MSRIEAIAVAMKARKKTSRCRSVTCFQPLASIEVFAEQLAWIYPPLSAAMNLQAATVPLTIANWGSAAVVDRYVPSLIAGELFGCNAMTEPDGGSDFLGAMRTRAVRDGADYVLNGAKMWITNANVADVAVVYAKTDADKGHRGVSAFYIASMALLCLHLSHGVGSTFQSIGFKNKHTAVWIDRVSKILAVIVFLGNSSMPLAVLAGILK
jgi:hypothetical protein